MKRNTGDAKEKHARTNAKHHEAVALRAQWLIDNADKSKEDWNYKTNFRRDESKKKWKTNYIGTFAKQNSLRMKRIFGPAAFQSA